MAKRKSFEELLDGFVEKYELEEKIDEKLKEKILNQATAYNKDAIMIELIRRIDEYRLYDEHPETASFPYKGYIEKFMQGIPKKNR